MSYIHNIKKDLSNYIKKDNPSKFFKTRKGEYAYKDIFLGVSIPDQRSIASKYIDIDLDLLEELIKSPIHEERSIALIILVSKFNISDIDIKSDIYNFYISFISYINNWDLVDMSAQYILGYWLYDKDRSILEKLALSDVLWERRIAIVSTHYFIKKKDYKDTFKIARILLSDKEDLIQKAIGWTLREVGKYCSNDKEEEFLKKYYSSISRTALRYSIERFSEEKRSKYLKGII